MRNLFVCLIVSIFVASMSCCDAGAQRRLPPDPAPYGNYGNGNKQVRQAPKPPPRRDFQVLRIYNTRFFPPDGHDRFRIIGNIEAGKADIQRVGGQVIDVDERMTEKLRQGKQPGIVFRVLPPPGQ